MPVRWPWVQPTWRPRIRQRQWLTRQHLYGHRRGQAKPARPITGEQAQEREDHDRGDR